MPRKNRKANMAACTSAITLAMISLASASYAQQTPAEKKADDDTTEVIVTGVLAATKAKKANAAYSSLTKEDIERFTPISAEDMLKDIPGVVVETNDGVTRNEVYTRGMTVGTGTNTTGNFWTTIMEDSLPIVPQRWTGFQDGYFYRADISTSKVESVRGGSTATTASASVGGTFNFLSADIRKGGALQVRAGFEGEDLHMSWRQADVYFGDVNEDRTRGFSVSGFYRTANGGVNPGYDLNRGGQFKIQAFQKYDAGNWGSGKFTAIVKYLDDINNVRTNFAQPAFGYENPEIVAGWGRSVDLYIRGGARTIYNGNGNTIYSDPEKGHEYLSKAFTLKWEHDFGNGWSFNNAIKIQQNAVDSDLGYARDVAPITTRGNFEQMGLGSGAGNNGILLRPGTFTLYDRETGAVRATLANNIGGSQLGINVLTGTACARVTSTTNAGLCLTSTNLPNRTFSVNGGQVYATNAARPATYLIPQAYPVSGTNTDLIMTTRGERAYRVSDDILGNFTAVKQTEHFNFVFGMYWDKSEMAWDQYGYGQGISAWADGQVSNLGIRFTDTTGKIYQVTDEGGWGGAGASYQYAKASYTELSPYFGISWSPNEHWDINFSYKYSRITGKTHYETWQPNAAYAASANSTNVLTVKNQTFGGADGNPLTLYDNNYYVYSAANVVDTDNAAIIRNVSGSVGYNFNRNHKVYYRYTDGRQSLFGLINRYRNQASANLVGLTPTAQLDQHELAYVFDSRPFKATVTLFYSDMLDPYSATGFEANNVDQYQTEILNRLYFTRGAEYSHKWRINKYFSWNSSVTFNNGKNLEFYNWLNLTANGLGRTDDLLEVTSAPLIRVAKYTTSNTFLFTYKDWSANLRHRYMDSRRVSNNPLNLITLPAQDNFDLSVQYKGIRDVQVTLDIRNLTNTSSVSAISRLISTLPSDVQDYDIYNQLPNSATAVKLNEPRSFWLTVKYNF